VGASIISNFATNSLANAPSRAVAHPYPEQDEPHVGPTLWQRRNIITWCAVISVAIAGLYLLVAPRRYTSFTEIYIVQDQAGIQPSDNSVQ
jgi:hypothetical protein